MDGTSFFPIEMTKTWWTLHGVTVGLMVLVTVQWFVLQGLLVHYYLFRKNLRRPRPDAVRLNLVEKTIALQAEQMDRVFDKLSEFRKDRIEVRQPAPRAKEAPSIEATYVSLGEMNLKKRIQQLKGATETVN